MNGVSWLPQELRLAMRLLQRRPAFGLTIVAVLALAIGATMAILSLVDRAFFQPLPYTEPSKLVAVFHRDAQRGRNDKATGAEVNAWRSSSIFADVAYAWDAQYTLTSLPHPQSVRAFQFSWNMFSLLGVRAALGRTFNDDDRGVASDHVAVLSDHFWRSAFGASRDVIGRAIRLDDTAYIVIGVMAPTFAHPDARMDLWTPLTMPAGLMNDRSLHVFNVIGRIREGEALAVVRSALGKAVRIEPLRDVYLGAARPVLWTLQGAVLLLLLIAVANIANLVLAHAITMRHETVIRRMLGASRFRLLAQFATMGGLVTAVGCIAALVLASFSVEALPALLGQFFEGMPIGFAAQLTPRAVAVCAGFALFIIVMIAALSVLGSQLSSAEGSLRGQPRGGTGPREYVRARRTILVGQLALSMVLLAASGLLVMSFLKLKQRSLGFETRDRTTFILQLEPNRYSTTEKVASYVDQLLARLRAMPGVQSAAATSAVPLSGMDARRRLLPLGARDSAAATVVHYRVASPDYFATLGIALRRGRSFRPTDREGGPAVAVINETLARLRWPNEDPLGRSVTIAGGPNATTVQIVGVVGDVRHEGLAAEPEPELYVTLDQAFWPFFGIIVRGAEHDLSLRTVQGAVWSVDPTQPIERVESMDALAATSLALRRTSMLLVSLFAVASALLAVVGVYGVIAYVVSLRTRELGIRLALGAEPGVILRNVVGSAAALGAVSVAVGVVSTYVLSRYLESLLFQVRPMDPLVLAGASLLTIVLAISASYVPARRAARIDPATTMRDE